MKFGARIFKTGIAVALSLYIAVYFGLPSPVFAGIAAIFAIQPSIYRSYQSILEQIQANFIGAFFAITFTLLFGNDPLIIGFTAIIVIAINLRLKMETTIPIAVVTLIAIMESPSENFIEFALIRFATIMLGIFSAFVVNLVFLPPKYETKLYLQILKNTEEIIKWTRLTTRHASDHTALKETIEKSKENLIKIDTMFLFYKEERIYIKKQRYAKARKLVLYRQMIFTMNKAQLTLKKLYQLENELNHAPKEFQDLIKNRLDLLLDLHDQIILKFAGKIKPNLSEDLMLEAMSTTLVERFIHLCNQKEDLTDTTELHLFPLVSSIMDYSHQLKRLDSLLGSFQAYHKQENEIKLTDV